MTSMPPDTPSPRQQRSVRRQLVLLALVAIAPVLAAYGFYYLWPRDVRTNYGTLVATPAPALSGHTLDGRAFHLEDLSGRWVLIAAAGGACNDTCQASLYAGRQARTIQNAERQRVVRVWMITDQATPPASVLDAHPDLMPVRVDPRELEALPADANALYLIDPNGNLVLTWPEDPDIKRMAKDLSRLLRASSIG